MLRQILSIILDTCRVIGTESHRLENVFIPDDLWFGSYTEHKLCYNM